MKITAPNLIRWTGLAALVGGIIFAGIQPIHPPDFLASVTTTKWAIIISLKLLMCFLFLTGIAGLYARQAEEAGWLGLIGFVLFSASWALQSGFVFAELFILPPLATTTPQFIDSYLGVVNGSPGVMDIGALVPTYTAVGILYLLGGLRVWHRDRPRRRPAALAGHSACRHGRGDSGGSAPSACDPAAGGDTDGGRSGLAGLCALVGTAAASRVTRRAASGRVTADACSHHRSSTSG